MNGSICLVSTQWHDIFRYVRNLSSPLTDILSSMFVPSNLINNTITWWNGLKMHFCRWNIRKCWEKNISPIQLRSLNRKSNPYCNADLLMLFKCARIIWITSNVHIFYDFVRLAAALVEKRLKGRVKKD